MKMLDITAATLVVLGGLNWGLVGVAQFDLVAALFGQASLLSRTIYTFVGVGALYQALQWKAIQQRWNLVPAERTV